MPKWTVEMDALLGTMKDADIVRRFNLRFSIGFVANRRRMLGIPYVRKRPLLLLPDGVDPNSKEATHHTNLYHKHGLTMAEFDAILEAQDGGCWICSMTPEEHGRRLFVDHDHNTGAIRGLLCCSCNIGLGYYQRNGKGFYNVPWLLSRVENYLLRSQIKREPRVLGEPRAYVL